MTKRIATALKKLPTTSGVYQFLDARKKVIYVGKAANLKHRVQSYFRTSADLSPAKQKMIGSVSDIHIIPTDSEIEALLLEANLIKKFQPHYNVTLRDDKSYLYVKISTEEEWPRVLTTRTIDHSGTYFGPFTSAHAVKETLRVLRKFLPYRCNQKSIESKTSPQPSPPTLRSGQASRRGRACPVRSTARAGAPEGPMGRATSNGACFWYHLGLCPGTCVGAISKTDYRKIIRRIRLFFEGRMDDLRRGMKKELGSERVVLMQNVLAHTRVLSVGDQYANDTRDLARVLGVTSLHRIEGYDISNIMGREAVGSMVVFQDGEPAKSEYKKFKIKTVHGGNDVAMLEEVLERRLKHSVANSKSQTPNPKQIQNSKFKILKSEISNLKSTAWSMPDLMIIDGGKAQLNAAVRVLRSFQGSSPCLPAGRDLSSPPEADAPLAQNNIVTVPVIAIAKGGHGGVLKQKEEIYFPGEAEPLKLPNASPALHLVLRVRDEAHRFAIGYHKVLRKKKFFL